MADTYPPHGEEAAPAAVSNHAPRSSEAKSRSSEPLEITTALLPLLAAVLAVALVWAAGFTERSLIGTPWEDHFYGYFFRSYPVLLFAMVYGAVRIAAAAMELEGRRGWRILSAPAAVALFLLAGFHPTFGGLIARAAFATGGMSFLQGQSAGLAIILAAAAAALMFGLALGAGVALARLTLSVGWTPVARGAISLLALWLGAVVLLQAQGWALEPVGGWPVRALQGGAALKLAIGVGLGLLPHTLVVGWVAWRRRGGGGRPPRRHIASSS